MELLHSITINIWSSLAPTTWMLLLGLLASFAFVRKSIL
jgi:hypothetical protein